MAPARIIIAVISAVIVLVAIVLALVLVQKSHTVSPSTVPLVSSLPDVPPPVNSLPTVPPPVVDPYVWSATPKNKVAYATESGNPMYVCRAEHMGVRHGGKLVDGKCSIGYGGKELNKDVFDYLDANSPTSWSINPANKVLSDTRNGVPLYVCRADHNGSKHAGKVVNGKCNIAYGGRELLNATFEHLGVN